MAKSRRPPIVLSAPDRARLERIRTDPHSVLKHVLKGGHRPAFWRRSDAVADDAGHRPVEADHVDADPGTRADADAPAGEAGPDPRLQAPRHDLPDGSPRHRHRKGHRPDGRAPPLRGVPRLPRPCRRGDRARNPGPCHSRQRLLPHVGRGQPMAEGAVPTGPSISPRHRPRG